MRTRDILLVEDRTDLQRLLSMFLESKGFDVAAASDGVKALEIMRQDKFRMIITDFNMPKMNGIELAAKAKNRIRIPMSL